MVTENSSGLRETPSELEIATAISDYLNAKVALEATRPLAWHQARGLSVELAKVVVELLKKFPPLEPFTEGRPPDC